MNFGELGDSVVDYSARSAERLLPISLVPEGISYARVVREQLDAAAFHDERFTADIPAEKRLLSIDLGDRLYRPNIHFIFHSSFCGSTLLARQVGSYHDVLSIREPTVLTQISSIRRQPQSSSLSEKISNDLIRRVLQAIGAMADDGETIVIKPSNFSNNLMADLMLLVPTARAILLSISLESFLTSILKKGELARMFVRKLYGYFLFDKGPFLVRNPNQLLQLTDLQIATLVWAVHVHEFHELMGRFGHERVVSLDGDEFLGGVSDWLPRLRSFLGLQHCAQPSTLWAGLSTHSKFDRPYTHLEREEERYITREKYAEEIEDTLAWAGKALRLPSKLVTNVPI